MRKEPLMPEWARKLLEISVGHRYYPFVVASIAFVATASFSFPFVLVLIPAVLLAPHRWLFIGLLCGITSGLGGAVLVEIFRYLGQELVLARYPELLAHNTWQLASQWLHEYGLWALACIAGSPLPQTPALLIYSLADPSTGGVMLAVGLGKTVKYVFLAWVTMYYPARLKKRRRRAPPTAATETK